MENRPKIVKGAVDLWLFRVNAALSKTRIKKIFTKENTLKYMRKKIEQNIEWPWGKWKQREIVEMQWNWKNERWLAKRVKSVWKNEISTWPKVGKTVKIETKHDRWLFTLRDNSVRWQITWNFKRVRCRITCWKTC